MARRDQFIKSDTDFVLRKKHTVTSKGIIYENDHMTIVPDDGMYDEDMVMFSDSNFKFRVRTDNNEKKKHFSGKWVSPIEGEEYWTADNCPATTISSETKIELKPDYSSIKDFAYYGSAVDLVKATVRDILLKYPCGLYWLGDAAETIKINGVQYYTISNEFGIDIWTKGVTPETVEDPLKYLSASSDKYLMGTSNEFLMENYSISVGDRCYGSIIAETVINGNTFYTYLTGEGKHVILVMDNLGGKGEPIIRLPQDEWQKRYDSLDDFSKILLDLSSKPLFKATLETPYFDGQSYYMTFKNYVWPSIATEDLSYFTPDLTSAAFNGYIDRLLSLAKFHDEYDSDNIWRMLTHQSIKNLDWTFKREKDGEVEDLSDFDTTRMKAALELYGRQFDDIKRYADNVKWSNTITYNEKNNIPDYFLTDSVENDGWDAYNVGPAEDNIVSDVLYTGVTYSGKNSSEANVAFMRRLAINSDYIQSMKGTKRGLETILKMFGMNEDDYKISEYVAIADNFPKECEIRPCLAYFDDFYYGDDIYGDWPVAIVEMENEGDSYMIPWFDNKKEYNSSVYFQQKGGWENTLRRKIDIPITTLTEISSNGDLDVYNETLQYMRYATNLYELTALTSNNLYDETVCYVEDISGLKNGYNVSPSDADKISGGSKFSHYFVLKNPALSVNLGYVDNEQFKCYGWRNVFEDEFDGSGVVTCDGTRVLYMESIKSIEIGNNPHVGYGLYDMGESYLDYFRQIFKAEIEHDRFSSLNDNDDMMGTIKSMGFGDCNLVEAESKTLSFFDEAGLTDSELTALGMVSAWTVTDNASPDSDVVNWDEGLYPHLVNPEGWGQKDEAASFSIINTKRINIEFDCYGNDYYKEYIENVVIKYIEQMMPSTAIFSYTFKGESMEATPVVYEMRNEGLFIAAEAEAVRGDNDNNYVVEDPLPEIV